MASFFHFLSAESKYLSREANNNNTITTRQSTTQHNRAQLLKESLTQQILVGLQECQEILTTIMDWGEIQIFVRAILLLDRVGPQLGVWLQAQKEFGHLVGKLADEGVSHTT